MTTPSPIETQARALIDFVVKLKGDTSRGIPEDRGALAQLRGALADSTERQMRAWPVLARFGGIPTEDTHKAEVVRTVAGLLAMGRLKHSAGAGSFGSACRSLLGDDERKSLYKPEQTGPVARRMQHMLAATRDEICPRVAQLGRRIEKEGEKLDFVRLYEDLLRWSDSVKAHWANDFWSGAEQEETQEESKAEGKNE